MLCIVILLQQARGVISLIDGRTCQCITQSHLLGCHPVHVLQLSCCFRFWPDQELGTMFVPRPLPVPSTWRFQAPRPVPPRRAVLSRGLSPLNSSSLREHHTLYLLLKVLNAFYLRHHSISQFTALQGILFSWSSWRSNFQYYFEIDLLSLWLRVFQVASLEAFLLAPVCDQQGIPWILRHYRELNPGYGEDSEIH